MTKQSKKINFQINVQSWKDRQTNCEMLYSKKYNISAYGKTKAEAKEMFLFQVDDILKPKK